MDPTSQAPEREHQRVGWFELFYDLVIVAAVGNGAHVFGEHPTWETGGWIAVTFLVMFLLWLLTVLVNNTAPGDHPWRRLLILLQMLAVVVACLSVGREEGLPDSVGFVALAVAFGSIALVYALVDHPDPRVRADARVISASTALSAVVLLVGAGVSGPWGGEGTIAPLLLLGAGIACAGLPLLTVVLGRASRDGRLDSEHLSERVGQLVLIVLGESFVSLVATLGGKPEIPNPFFFVLTFAVVFAIWSIYFSTVMPGGVPTRQPGRLRTWLALHWLLMFGAVGAASGFATLAVVPFATINQGLASAWTPAPLLYVMIALAGLAALAGERRLLPLHGVACAILLVLVVVQLTVAQGGRAWEIALGAVVVIVDAIVSVRVMRPYDRTPG